MNSLPTTVRTLWRQIAIGRALLVGLIGAVALGVTWSEFETPAALLAIPLGVALVMAVVGWWWAGARWRSWSFALNERWMEATWGVVNRRTVTIPRNRVQTVTTADGPIDRFLKLTSITIHTAGISPNLSIPHLEDTTVEWLRTELGQGVATT